MKGGATYRHEITITIPHHHGRTVFITKRI